MDEDEVHLLRSFQDPSKSEALNQEEHRVRGKQACFRQESLKRCGCDTSLVALNSHRRIQSEAGEKGWRIVYREEEKRGHVSTEYCTTGSQPGLDGCTCAVIVSVL